MLPGYRNPTREPMVEESGKNFLKAQVLSDRIVFEGIYCSIGATTGEIMLKEIEEIHIDPQTVSLSV
jgi:hypothetical protein